MNQQTLKQLLHYDPETGQFTWLISKRRTRAGMPAGSLNNGYVSITINGKAHLAHRLAWLYVYGKWPEHTIDHDDGNRSNNRIKNLNDKTHAQNLQSFHKPRSNNKSGFRGVTWNEKLQAWVGAYMRDGVSHFCGVHNSPEAAAKAILDHKNGREIAVRADPRSGYCPKKAALHAQARAKAGLPDY